MRQTRSTPLVGMEAESFHELVLTMGMEFRGSELNKSPVHAMERLESGHI